MIQSFSSEKNLMADAILRGLESIHIAVLYSNIHGIVYPNFFASTEE